MSNQFNEGQIVKHSSSGVVGKVYGRTEDNRAVISDLDGGLPIDMGSDDLLSDNGWSESQGFDFGSLSYNSAPWEVKNSLDDFASESDATPEYLFGSALSDLTSDRFDISDIHTEQQAWDAILGRADTNASRYWG